jgi:hypothetical protein
MSAPRQAANRVAGAVARPGSHRTVRALVAHGSSGRRVVNPTAGRLATSIYLSHPNTRTWPSRNDSIVMSKLKCTIRPPENGNDATGA